MDELKRCFESVLEEGVLGVGPRRHADVGRAGEGGEEAHGLLPPGGGGGGVRGGGVSGVAAAAQQLLRGLRRRGQRRGGREAVRRRRLGEAVVGGAGRRELGLAAGTLLRRGRRGLHLRGDGIRTRSAARRRVPGGPDLTWLRFSGWDWLGAALSPEPQGCRLNDRLGFT